MKRVLFIFISLMICVCGYSQKHMKFQGIEIDGTKKAFVDQLIKKGYKYVGPADNMELLSGTFTSKKAIVAVTSNSDNNVISVGVMLPEKTEWKALVNEYNYYQNLYSQKYGMPVEVNEKDGSGTDDNYIKMMALGNGETEWECWFETEEGEILLSIKGSKGIIDRSGHIIIMYRDKTNFLENQNKDIDDI